MIKKRPFVARSQILVIFLIVFIVGLSYDLLFGDGSNIVGVETPLPYSLYAVEIISFIVTAVLLLALRKKYKLAILPWVVCGAVALFLLIYWWREIHWLRSDNGSMLEFLQYSLGAHNYDRIDPSLQSMWPTFWRFQIPFVIAMAVSYLALKVHLIFRQHSPH
jgi:hypothetical protein